MDAKERQKIICDIINEKFGCKCDINNGFCESVNKIDITFNIG